MNDNSRFLACLMVGVTVVLLNPAEGQFPGPYEVTALDPDDNAVDDDTLVALKGPDDAFLEVRADQLRMATMGDMPLSKVRLVLDLDVRRDYTAVCVEDMVGMLVRNVRSAITQGLLTADADSLIASHEITSILDPKPTRVVVEVKGGNVQDVTGAGDVDVLVVDYDNGDDDTPQIPGSRSTASVACYELRGEADRERVEQINDLIEVMH